MKKTLLSLFLALATVTSIGVVAKADEVSENNTTIATETKVEKAYQDGWVKRGSLYYYYKDGVQLTGWQWIDGNYYYLNNHMYTGERSIDGTTYKFSNSGAMLTGWQKDDNGNFEFFGTNGAKYQKQWYHDGYDWYYLDYSGHMAIGEEYIGDYEFYFDHNGVMQTGWRSYYDEGGYLQYKYYAPGGAMYEDQWLNENGTWYHFDFNGEMERGKQYIDGREYYFYDNGAKFSGWMRDEYYNEYWTYHGGSGQYENEWLYENGCWYYFDYVGWMVTGEQLIDGHWYYFGDNGVMH